MRKISAARTATEEKYGRCRAVLRICADLPQSAAAPRFKKFEDIRLRDVGCSWSIVVRVDVKFPVQAHREIQHFILMDITGSKIEAIVRGTGISRFNMLLTQGCNYTVHEVRFQIENNVEFRNIDNPFECYFDNNTIVEPYTVPIQFPLYPRHTTSFSELEWCSNSTFVVGIVVHWGQLEYIGTFPDRKLYREVILMDKRRRLLVVGIWSKLLARHAISLPTAAANNQVILGTMLRINHKHRCLETSDHTVFGFNPAHRATDDLQSVRRLLATKSIGLSFVNRFLEHRWAYLATVV
ncbi:unnamed protein product [Urochloa decumbens]|uniref:Replication protein A 70 kDa DNA-binding subunit B/D first OB fold domain-containing protein n=1 Tax=Urochloa decumbens TaxID=240449 RepID=A0ABC9GHV0_9POAL